MIIITTLSLLVCIFVSYLSFTFMSNKQAVEELKEYSTYFEQNAKKISSMPQLEDFLLAQYSNQYKITIISKDGKVIYDKDKEKLRYDNFDEDNFFKDVLAGDEVYRTDTPYTDNISMMSYYKSFDGEQYTDIGTFVIRYSTYIIYNNQPFWILIGIGAAVWLVIVLGIYFIFNKALTSAQKPMVDIQNMLVDIEHGDYNGKTPKLKIQNSEFNKIFTSINEISENISQTLNTLKIEQQKSNFLMQSMNQGVIVVSSSGKILMNNAAVVEIFRTENNIVGVPLDYLIKDRELLAKLEYALDNQSYIVYNAEINSNVYRIETMFSKDNWFGNAEELLMLVLLTDITQENKSANIRSEFFANASHELKTPLTAIRGYSEILTMTTEQNKIEKCAEEINSNAIKMLNLIDNMLKLSRMDADIDSEEITKFSLGKLCDEVCDEQMVTAQVKEVTLAREGEDIDMFARKNMVKMLVSNLVNNAIKYNKENGSVKVVIGSDNSKIWVSVEDTGIGIAPKYQGRIFERFFMVDNARTKSDNMNTGIGLAIVKHIAIVHSANIEVESKENVGTKIKIIFSK
ncbi:MAG: HAMP domain-containing sensor histidine kinase [Clostridia bacterium]